jgi:hypothetical protein
MGPVGVFLARVTGAMVAIAQHGLPVADAMVQVDDPAVRIAEPIVHAGVVVVAVVDGLVNGARRVGADDGER